MLLYLTCDINFLSQYLHSLSLAVNHSPSLWIALKTTQVFFHLPELSLRPLWLNRLGLDLQSGRCIRSLCGMVWTRSWRLGKQTECSFGTWLLRGVIPHPHSRPDSWLSCFLFTTILKAHLSCVAAGEVSSSKQPSPKCVFLQVGLQNDCHPCLHLSFCLLTPPPRICKQS